MSGKQRIILAIQTFPQPIIKTQAALLIARFLAGSHTASSQQRIQLAEPEGAGLLQRIELIKP